MCVLELWVIMSTTLCSQALAHLTSLGITTTPVACGFRVLGNVCVTQLKGSLLFLGCLQRTPTYRHAYRHNTRMYTHTHICHFGLFAIMCTWLKYVHGCTYAFWRRAFLLVRVYKQESPPSASVPAPVQRWRHAGACLPTLACCATVCWCQLGSMLVSATSCVHGMWVCRGEH